MLQGSSGKSVIEAKTTMLLQRTDAGSYCSSLSLASRTWRLPNRQELETLPNYSQSNPSIDTRHFLLRFSALIGVLLCMRQILPLCGSSISTLALWTTSLRLLYQLSKKISHLVKKLYIFLALKYCPYETRFKFNVKRSLFAKKNYWILSLKKGYIRLRAIYDLMNGISRKHVAKRHL